MNKRNIFLFLLLTVLIFTGLWFRLKGINANHSFWADEAFISSVSRDIATGKTPWIKGVSIIGYQYLQIVITALSFILFGVSEFSARLPTVLFSVLGILFAYLVAKKLSNWSGGLLAAFLMTFSQLNLAHSTQAKPYITLQTLLLIQVYLLIKYIDTKKGLILILIFICNSLAFFFQPLAVLFWIPIGIVLIATYYHSFTKVLRQPIFLLCIMGILSMILFYFGVFNQFVDFLKPLNGHVLFIYNNTIYLKNIFLRQYGVYLIPALLSFILISKKYRGLIIGLTVYSTALLFLWNFRSYSHNLRYLMTFFGLIFVFFGVFWAKLGEKLNVISKNFTKNVILACPESTDPGVASLPRMTIYKILSIFSKTLPLLILVVIYISGYKIVRTPQDYYSPNLDLYGDVQNADYKTMYSWIEKKYGKNLDKIAIFNDLIDSERFYLKRISDAYFMKEVTKPYQHGINKKMIYGTLDDFLKQKSRYSKGILIVEDWESYLPEDIKQYAKKNMKLEYRVEKMTVGGERDIWPLEVRSWGM